MYNGVNQGEEMPPTVSLTPVWPVMLMVFIGIMTLPTLVISAVTVARIPTVIDTSTITASIDSGSLSQLSTITSNLTTIKAALDIHTTNLANNVSAYGNAQSGGTYVDANGDPSTPSGTSTTQDCVADTSTSPFHPTDMYLIAHYLTNPSVPSTATPHLIAKMCKPCGSAKTIDVRFAGGSNNQFTSKTPWWHDTYSSNTELPTVQLNSIVPSTASVPGEVNMHGTYKMGIDRATMTTTIDFSSALKPSVTWATHEANSEHKSNDITWKSIKYKTKKTGYVADSVEIHYHKKRHPDTTLKKDSYNNLQLTANLPTTLQTAASALSAC
jgi:hypothetical protein